MSAPVLPVAAFAAPAGLVERHRELAVADLSDEVLASLVRVRLDLVRAHGWVLLACIAAALACVGVVGVGVDSRVVFGACATAAACGSVGLGFVAERLSQLWFRAYATPCGLSAAAADELFLRAAEADHWQEVLAACDHAPTDEELARFVREQRPR